MKKLTQNEINKSKVKDRAKKTMYEIMRDTEVPELYYRVCAKGGYYYIQYTSPVTKQARKKYSIPNTTGLLLVDVRNIARGLLYNIANGIDPSINNSTEKTVIYPTIKEVVELYEPWLEAHSKSTVSTMYSLRSFRDAPFWEKRINELTKGDFIEWQSQMMKTSLTRNTINKKFTMLRAAINKLMENETIPRVELKFPSKLKETDSKIKDRYLLPFERDILLKETIRLSNTYPYILPAVILSLNTGVRRGTLLELKWDDVDTTSRTLSLRSSIMKGGKNCIIPLNAKAIECLSAWKAIAPSSEYIICGQRGEQISISKIEDRWAFLIEKTGIKNFTWHNMRHDFASQLVMAGVDLYVVKELMCHSNISMTARYAHLAPSLKSNAVDRLNNL